MSNITSTQTFRGFTATQSDEDRIIEGETVLALKLAMFGLEGQFLGWCTTLDQFYRNVRGYSPDVEVRMSAGEWRDIAEILIGAGQEHRSQQAISLGAQVQQQVDKWESEN